MFKKILQFFKVLNSNRHPGEIAHAVCLGMMLGFLPKNNALWYILTIFFVFLRINKGTFAVYTFLFSLLAPLLDVHFDNIGYWILTQKALEPAFTWLLDVPFLSFTKINNSIVMGSLAVSIIAYIPLYWLVRLFTKFWRTNLAPVVRKTKLITFLSKIPLIVKIGESL
ncbi:MAG: TIGR03546 family protein [Treponema sp.]|nr:TIGR03546 family protein [Treponema sp.]